MDFIHWLHRERGLELSIFSSNTNIFWLVWVHRQKGFKSNRAFTWFRRLTSLFIPHGKIWMVSIYCFVYYFTGFIVEQYLLVTTYYFYDGKDNAIWGWEVVGGRGLYPKSRNN
ncbi:hypothetical protein J3E68DRAFT_379979 [Trichoderma sp. SZMC 28012]